MNMLEDSRRSLLRARPLRAAWLIALAAAILLLAACNSTASPSPSILSTLAPSPSPELSASPAASADSSATLNTTISIANLAFSPASLTVPVGTTVTWANADTVTHQIKWSDGGPGSNPLAPGATYTRTFTVAGIYPYSCAIHASMTGTIIVN